ncbi:GGDEF domain-containing protein [Marinomonas sp. A79]|uniref:diguanylate cyclase n=1 Tax=Marinomonas vulgaris TaxID=2823372 RepID=A0ABS5H7I5_9GAMM|nr:GGDEF domain-containing protein [Marinomonas vulgaris]MBR7887683.1 GGDEF domain-containing protein [Marinomonas vulgaris]
MTESSSDELVTMLRKAVSRTSMLAEGNDPKLDAVVRQIRQAITKGANADDIQTLLKNAEPLLIKSDEEQQKRARLLRSTLEELVDLLDKQEGKRVPHTEKKKFESQIRLHWQTSSQWPLLIKSFLTLAENTLNSAEPDQPRSSFLSRLFQREGDAPRKNDHEVMTQISHSFIGLMNNLSLPSLYDDDVSDLKNALKRNESLQDLPELLDEVIHLIMVAIGKTQENLTKYLSQLNQQLASINESITSSAISHKSLSKSREGFNSQLETQVNDTFHAVKHSTDLDSLKSLIDDRLTVISNTMTDYKTQMIEQEKQASQSISSLKNKVVRMEKDTVSLRSMLQEKLAQAMTDSLTDLPNRTAYQDAILPLCKIMQKTSKPMCLAVCDIDHFKSVNDTWGHLAGDKVLRLVPKQIRSVLKKEDLMFRYGGEEFVIAFPNMTLEQAMARTELVRLAVAKTPFNVQGEPVSISISIGLAQLEPEESPEALFERADKQLYLAKEAGRNRVMGTK